MRNHIIFFSGGKSSFTVAHHVKQNYPNDNILCYFTDTLWEDEDLFRFMYEAIEKLELPFLYHCVGINPLQIAVLEQFMPNSRVGLCSQRLKMEPAADFFFRSIEPKIVEHHNWDKLKRPISPLEEGFIENTTLYFGIGWDEAQREPKIKANWQPFNVDMPLMYEFYDNNEILAMYDIAEPELYKKKFVHNNCRGRCVKAGQAHFRNLYEQDRATYIELMEQEAIISEYIRYTKQPQIKSGKSKDYLFDDVWAYATDGTKSQKLQAILLNSMILKNRLFGWQPKAKSHRKEPYTFMKKQKDGTTFQYALHMLRDDIESENPEVDAFDYGGCGCFIDDDSSQKCNLNALLQQKQNVNEAEKSEKRIEQMQVIFEGLVVQQKKKKLPTKKMPSRIIVEETEQMTLL